MKIIFLGPQGSGKSTQAELLSESLSLPRIEMGQLFRDIATTDETKQAEDIKKSLSSGVLVPDEIAVKTLHHELEKPKYRGGFVLDGYPRNIYQYSGLNFKPDSVFYVKVSDEEAIKRLAKRSREDDTPELLEKRLNVYHELTEPLLERFEKEGILKEINGERTIEEIHEEIENVLKNENKSN